MIGVSVDDYRRRVVSVVDWDRNWHDRITVVNSDARSVHPMNMMHMNRSIRAISGTHVMVMIVSVAVTPTASIC